MGIPFQFQRTQPSPYAWLSAPPQPDVQPSVASQPPADLYSPIPDVPNLTPNDSSSVRIMRQGDFRPKLDATISDPLEAQKALRQNLELYEPQKSHGLARLGPVVPSALAGAGAGGGWGALGGLGIGLLMSKLDPTFTERMKKQRELAKTNQIIGTLQGEKDANIQDKLRQAQLGNIQSEIESRKVQPRLAAEEAKQEQRKGDIATLLTMHQRLGHYNPADLNDAGSQTLLSRARELGVESSLVPYSAKETADKVPPHLTVGDTVFERGDDGTWKPATGLPTVAPKSTSDASFTNAQIQTSINEALREKAKVASALRDTAQTVPDIQGGRDYGTKKPNPIYEDLQKHDRNLDNQIREWRMKLKPESVGPKTSGAIKPARDGKFHYTPDQIRQSLAPGQTYEEIYGKLKANPRVIIEE